MSLFFRLVSAAASFLPFCSFLNTGNNTKQTSCKVKLPQGLQDKVPSTEQIVVRLGACDNVLTQKSLLLNMSLKYKLVKFSHVLVLACQST